MDIAPTFGSFILNPLTGFDSHTASIDQTFARVNPVFALCQCVVIHATALFQPVKHLSFLVKSWIDSVAVGQIQHTDILTDLYLLLEPIDSVSIFSLIEPLNRHGMSMYQGR
jgi:hypothetical protein